MVTLRKGISLRQFVTAVHPPGGAPFTPLDIPGLKAWFNAANLDKVTLSQDNSTVAYWGSEIGEVLGAEQLVTAWEDFNLSVFSSTGPDNADFEGNDILTKMRCTSDGFAATIGQVFKLTVDVNITELTGSGARLDFFIISTTTSSSGKSNKIGFDSVGTFHYEGYLVSTVSEATVHLYCGENANDANVKASFTNLKLEAVTSAFDGRQLTTSAMPLHNGVDRVEFSTPDEFLDFTSLLSTIKGDIGGEFIIEASRDALALEIFFGFSTAGVLDWSFYSDASGVWFAFDGTNVGSNIAVSDTNIHLANWSSNGSRFKFFLDAVERPIVTVPDDGRWFASAAGTSDQLYMNNVGGTFSDFTVKNLFYIDNEMSDEDRESLFEFLGY